MAVRLDKPWRDLAAAEVARVAGHLGVYQLGDREGNILLVGVADARTRFGLRGELERALADPPPGAARFRVEVTMSYRSRHAELLAAFVHDRGRLPPGNADTDPRSLGRLRPGGAPPPALRT